MIMQGLLRRSIPLLLRRLVTLIPALVILAIGVDPSRALVLSQVVLSFGIPFALIPLVRLTSNPSADGRRRQPPVDHRPGVDGRRTHYSAQCGADLSDLDGLELDADRRRHLYFAYGSNLCVQQMARRCPDADRPAAVRRWPTMTG